MIMKVMSILVEVDSCSFVWSRSDFFHFDSENWVLFSDNERTLTVTLELLIVVYRFATLLLHRFASRLV